MRHGRVRQGSGRTRERMWKQARKKEAPGEGRKEGRDGEKQKDYFGFPGRCRAELAWPGRMQCSFAFALSPASSSCAPHGRGDALPASASSSIKELGGRARY